MLLSYFYWEELHRSDIISFLKTFWDQARLYILGREAHHIGKTSPSSRRTDPFLSVSLYNGSSTLKPRRRLKMANYREVLQSSSEPKNTQQSVPRAVRSSRDTLRDVLAAAGNVGVTWSLDESVTNEMPKAYFIQANSPHPHPISSQTIPTFTPNWYNQASQWRTCRQNTPNGARLRPLQREGGPISPCRWISWREMYKSSTTPR